MSDQDISLELQKREVVRKGLNKLRSEGLVPAVIHDHGKPSINVMADYQKMAKLYEEAGKHHPVHLTVGDRKDLAIIKDINFDPVKHRMKHIVFQAIRQNEKVETEVPVVLNGEIPAEKAGLMVITHLSVVAAEALPKDLPDELKVDVSKLIEVGDKITVADIQIPEGVTVLTEPETLIASVEETKAQISEETEEAEAEETEKTEGSAKESSEEE